MGSKHARLMRYTNENKRTPWFYRVRFKPPPKHLLMTNYAQSPPQVILIPIC